MMKDNLTLALDQFENRIGHISERIVRLRNEADEMSCRLRRIKPSTQLARENPLRQIAETIHQQVCKTLDSVDQARADAMPMRELADYYQDRPMLLVYGKVNVSKSSLINYIAECFRNETLRYFYMDEKNGEVKAMQGPFAEGATETTAVIQWVEIGKKLVIMDSPGLKSVTTANEALTLRYMDAADAVLWITSSQSPGQRQELEDLVEQARLKKPLLPVISKSDDVEEDELPDGELVKLLISKSAATRQLQEQDVLQRSREAMQQAGFSADIRQPVSVSVRWHRQAEAEKQNTEASGINQLFETLAGLIQSASGYKLEKAGYQELNFMENRLIKPFDDIAQSMDRLIHESQSIKTGLNHKREQLIYALRSCVLEKLPALVEQHKESRGIRALEKSLQKLLQQESKNCLQPELEAYLQQVDDILIDLPYNSLGDYQENMIEVTRVSGYQKRSLIRGAGSLIGGGIGLLTGGPVGMVIGGLAGGYAGEKIGGTVIKTSTSLEASGVVDCSDVLKKSASLCNKVVEQMVAGCCDSICQSIDDNTLYAQTLSSAIHDFNEQLQATRESTGSDRIGIAQGAAQAAL